MMVAMPHVMTVTGPIAPTDLGPTDAHEHLFLATPAQPDDTMADLSCAVAELEDGRDSGLGAIVELTPIGLGRQPRLLRDASQATGVQIVAATGYHRDAHYSAGDWVFAAPEHELAERVIADLREGMEDGIRAGVIKGGASHEHLTQFEKRRLRAVAAASIETGAPIVVHTEAGTAGPDIVDLLTRCRVAPERVTLAHLDRNPDRGLHRSLLERGINLVYDTIGRTKYAADADRVVLIADMVEAGFVDRVMLGLDLGRRAYHRAYGGSPGMRHLMSTFVPLVRAEVGNDAVNAMLIANPARFLAMPS